MAPLVKGVSSFDQGVGDPNGIEREDIIAVLGSRQQICPLEGENRSHKVVLAKLADSLNNFKCKNHSDGDVINLASQQLKEVSQQSSFDLGQRVSIISGVFENLVQLKDHNKCADDLRKKSFLQRLADTVMGLSSLKLLSDSDNSFYVASGGIVISSLLKLIDRFLTKDYEWDDYGDRVLFNSLNCSFYYIRLDLHQLGLFELELPHDPQRRKELEGQRDQLVDENKILDQNLQRWDQLVVSESQKFLNSKIPSQVSQLYRSLEQLWGELRSARQIKDEMTQLFAISIYGRDIYEKINDDVLSSKGGEDKLLQEIGNALSFFSTSYGFMGSQEGVLNAFWENNNLSHDQLDDADVRTFLDWFTALLHHSITLHHNRVEEVKNEWEKSSGWAALHSQYQKDQKLLEKQRLDRDRLEKKIAILDSNNLQGHYQLDDVGVNDLVTIYDYYEEMIKKIYLRQGKSFVKHIKKELKDNFNSFIREHEVFQERDYFKASFLSGTDLNRACVRAEHTLQLWGVAHGWSQYAFDFYMTNIDIFHDLKGYKKKLQEEAYSVLHAWVIMDTVSDWEQASEGLHAASMGDWMLKIQSSKAQAQALQQFVREDCKEINSWRTRGK